MVKRILKRISPGVFLKSYHLFWAFFSSLFFGFPSRKMVVLGITGTKGKSSVVEILNSILEEAGLKTAISSSLRFKIGERSFDNNFKMTMPGRGFLEKLLRQAKKAGDKIALIEVTSEGILQYRHRFIDFDIRIFLNLQPEHLERHGGFENYKKAKGELFKNGEGKIHILNLDDKEAEFFLAFPAGRKIGYSLKVDNPLGKLVDEFIFLESYNLSEKGTNFRVNVFGREFFSRLIGEFNLYNILAALSAARALGVGEETISRALSKFKGVPGRFEIIKGKDFEVILDYAHTPDSLEAVLKTIRNVLKPSYLVCLIGSAGGGRDKWKRPEIGRVASRYCQKIILANEDPYDEDPQAILEEIKQGLPKGTDFLEILDREEAIKKGIEIAKSKPGSAFGVFGKGAERLMCLEENRKIAWSDRKIIERFLA